MLAAGLIVSLTGVEDFSKYHTYGHTYLHTHMNVIGVHSKEESLDSEQSPLNILHGSKSLPLKVYLIFGNGRKSFGACDVVTYNKKYILVFIPSP